MEAVKAFASRCMEEENATAMYDVALLEFEGHFDDVFEDLDGWMFGGPNGTVLPLDEMCIALTRVDAVLMATLNALNRWSLSGLQDQTDVIIDTLVNVITVSKVGTWVYIHESVPGASVDAYLPKALYRSWSNREDEGRVARYALPASALEKWTRRQRRSLQKEKPS